MAPPTDKLGFRVSAAVPEGDPTKGPPMKRQTSETRPAPARPRKTRSHLVKIFFVPAAWGLLPTLVGSYLFAPGCGPTGPEHHVLDNELTRSGQTFLVGQPLRPKGYA